MKEQLTINQLDVAKSYLIEYVLMSLDNGHSDEDFTREIEAMETVAKSIQEPFLRQISFANIYKLEGGR